MCTGVIRKMGGKKNKSGEKVGGQKKRPLFQKPNKMENLKKIKNARKIGGQKTFKKWARSKKKRANGGHLESHFF